MSAPAKSDAVPVEASAQPVKSGSSMMPLIMVVVLVPALCYGVMDFVVIPKLKASLQASAIIEGGDHKAEGKSEGGEHKAEGGEHKAESKSEGHGEKGAKKEHGKEAAAKGAEHTAEFGATMVNLAGGGGTRYLRVNFVLAGVNEHLEELVKANMSALKDVAITVLGAQSMSTLDAPGGRNLIRNELIAQFNRKLGGEVIDQLYFSEFVVQ